MQFNTLVLEVNSYFLRYPKKNTFMFLFNELNYKTIKLKGYPKNYRMLQNNLKPSSLHHRA